MKTVLIVVILTVFLQTSLLQETEECKCVSYFLCNGTTGTIIDDGSVTGLITERLGGCVCTCPVKEIKQVCCRLNSNGTLPQEKVTSIPCGVRNPDGVGYKISVRDKEIKFGEFPWFVDILVDSGISRCGGALIHPSVVLTAAHCVAKKQTYIVRAGEWDNSKTTEIFPHQDLLVASKKIHEDYNPAVYYNDIALLFLSGSLNLTSHIQPVCLSPKNFVFGNENERCLVVGRSKDKQGNYPPIPKLTDLALVHKNECNRKLRQTKLGKNFNLHRSALCAGGEEGKDACLGDGGGSLVCPIDGEENRYQQVGMVSWGVGCHQEGLPGVYANTAYLRDWIDKEMKDNNLKTSQYIYQNN